MTLSVLAKGPVAILIPSLVFVAWFFIHERPRREPLASWGLAAMLWCVISLAISATWYVLAYRSGGGAFWDRVWYENIARFSGTMEDNPHSHGPLYLVGQLFVGTMPWSLVVVLNVGSRCRRFWNVPQQPVAVMTRIADNSATGGTAIGAGSSEPRIQSHSRLSRWYTPFVDRMFPQGVRAWWGDLQPLERFSIVVAMVVFCFYEIPRGKRGVYLLPAYPYLAIVCTRTLLRTNVQYVVRGTTRLIGAVTIVAGLLLILAGLSVVLFGIDVAGTGSWFYPLMALLYDSVLGGGWFAITALMLAVTLTIASVVPPPEGVGSDLGWYQALNLARVTLGLLIFVQGVVQPAIARSWSEQYIAERMEGIIAETDKIVSWNREFYGVSFYLRRPIFRAESTPRLGEVCILPAEDLDELRKALSPPLQPIPVVFIKRGILPSDTVLVVKIASPGSGLGAV